MDLELGMKNALRREEPSPGFTTNVMRRIDGQGMPVVHPWRAVAAAGLLTAFLGGWALREAAVQRAKGEQAREQVLLALRITSEKLRDARNHVREIGTRN